jgi:hypothetical protein
MVFINIAVLEKLGLVDQICNEEISTCLFECLLSLDEAFTSGQRYAEAQKLMLEILLLKPIKFQKDSLNHSFSLIMMRYQYFQPGHIRKRIIDLNHSTTSEINIIDTSLSRAISLGIMVDQNSHGFYQ